MDIRSPETCSRWPSCGCYDCEETHPRSRWAAPFIVVLCLLAWTAILSGVWYALEMTKDAAEQQQVSMK